MAKQRNTVLMLHVYLKGGTKYKLMEQMMIIIGNFFFGKEVKPHDGLHPSYRRVIRGSCAIYFFARIDARYRYPCTYMRIDRMDWRKGSSTHITTTTIIIVFLSRVMERKHLGDVQQDKREKNSSIDKW